MAALFQRVAIIGTGLIGGSFALALKQRRLVGHVTGTAQPDSLRAALDHGVIDEAFDSVEHAVAGADLVFIATPVLAILDVLERVHSAAPHGAMVTDAGSTKSRIAERASKVFADGPIFIGGHPMAGKEQSGVEGASPDLFRNATWALTPWRRTDLDTPPALAFRGCIERLGAKPLVLDAEVHDEIVAWTSHLPQLAATALAATVHENVPDDSDVRLAGPGLRDTTRLADSSYRLWRDICLTNEENVAVALTAMIEKLEHVRDALKERDLEKVFQSAQQLRRTLGTKFDNLLVLPRPGNDVE